MRSSHSARPALVPLDRRLIIGARGDAICTPEHADALWRHWERSRIHWYSGGHLLQLGRRAALADVQRLVDDAGLLPGRRIAIRVESRPLASGPRVPRAARRRWNARRSGAPRAR